MRLFRQSRTSIPAEFLLVVALTLPASGGDLIDNTLETGGNLFHTAPMTVLGSALAATAGVYLVENKTGCEGFLPGEPFSALDRADEFLYGPLLPASSAGLWLVGMTSGEQWAEDTGEELCRGLLWTYGLTAGLKYSFQRTRPNGEDNLSFPSAHAAGASCTAAVLWSRHGSAAGIPAAALALYTCFSRVNLGKHFPSDVVMGAALGTACGLAASLDGKEEENGNDFSLGFSIDTEGRILTKVW
jgi:hypothetical protein